MGDLLTCYRCGAADAPRLRWQTCSNGRRHLRADCAVCGAFLKWLAQTADNVALVEVPDEPDSPAPGREG
jgi:hypothetical protein